MKLGSKIVDPGSIKRVGEVRGTLRCCSMTFLIPWHREIDWSPSTVTGSLCRRLDSTFGGFGLKPSTGVPSRVSLQYWEDLIPFFFFPFFSFPGSVKIMLRKSNKRLVKKNKKKKKRKEKENWKLADRTNQINCSPLVGGMIGLSRRGRVTSRPLSRKFSVVRRDFLCLSSGGSAKIVLIRRS